jgi:hypothetical protein
MAKIIQIDEARSATVRLPGPRDRIAIIGPTGSGKTVAALWHLANSNFDRKPWLIVDPKIDSNIEQIDNVIEIGIGDKLPKHPGLYIVHPLPGEMRLLDDMFMRIWEHENIGIYCDEGYMNADGDGFLACLTQGRSKRVPMIILAQRPVFISRFVWSESQFFQAFNMTDEDDLKKLMRFMRAKNGSMSERTLPDFHSWYFDVNRKMLSVFKPVPKVADTIQRIEDKLDMRKPVRRMM